MRSSDTVRLTENLKGIRALQLEIGIDLGEIEGVPAERLQRNARSRVLKIIEANGIDVKTQSTLPILIVNASLRVFQSTVEQSVVFLYAVEVSLRESVTIPREATDSGLADTWRQRPTVNSRLVSLASSDTTPVLGNEIENQIETFLADWRSANDVVDPETQTRDDLAGLINGIGRVFERRLNDSGIFTLRDVSGLTDDEIEILATSFGQSQADGENRLKDWRNKATSLITV